MIAGGGPGAEDGRAGASPPHDSTYPRRWVLLALTLSLGSPFLGRLAARAADPREARPRTGDRFVLATATASRTAIAPADLPRGGPPVIAYPLDAATRVVRDGSRLNQVLLIALDPRELADETRGRAAAGVVAYSAVCTHTGCDLWEWMPESRAIKCPCHFSVFDVKDGARVLDGPAPRRLPALPLRVEQGVLAAAAGFTSRAGFQQGGG